MMKPNSKTVARRFYRTSPGFSLVEIFLLMAILSVLTIPMVMMLNLQQDSIEKNRQAMISETQTGMIFDQVEVHHGNVVGLYTNEEVTADEYTRYSLPCDPASRVGSSNTYSTHCTTAEFQTEPFFVRKVDFTKPDGVTPDHLGIETTVELYHTKDDLSQAPYFKAKRVTQLDAYRVNVGHVVEERTDINVYKQMRGFDSYMAADAAGQLWYPAWTLSNMPDKVVPGFDSDGLTTRFTNFLVATRPCKTNQDPPSNQPVPFHAVQLLKSTACPAGNTLVFKVAPNKTYDIEIYLASPKMLTESPGIGNCSSNTHEVSCFLTDVDISLWDQDYTTQVVAQTYRNYDVNAATGFDDVKNQGVTLHTTITTRSDTRQLAIQVRPTTPPVAGSVTIVGLAGVTLQRRDDI